MDASVTTALATLLGAAIGGLTSVLATWLTHRTQARAQWLEQETLRRCYVHALQHEHFPPRRRHAERRDTPVSVTAPPARL